MTFTLLVPNTNHPMNTAKRTRNVLLKVCNSKKPEERKIPKNARHHMVVNMEKPSVSIGPQVVETRSNIYLIFSVDTIKIFVQREYRFLQ